MDELLSVDQVAEWLGLHVRTVRNYVRSGRLKAVRIGKQYRISQADLAELTGSTGPIVEPESHVEVSAVVDMTRISRTRADRLSTMLMASVAGAARVQTIHDRERSTLKIVVIGDPVPVAEVLRLIDDLREVRE